MCCINSGKIYLKFDLQGSSGLECCMQHIDFSISVFGGANIFMCDSNYWSSCFDYKISINKMIIKWNNMA